MCPEVKGFATKQALLTILGDKYWEAKPTMKNTDYLPAHAPATSGINGLSFFTSLVDLIYFFIFA